MRATKQRYRNSVKKTEETLDSPEEEENEENQRQIKNLKTKIEELQRGSFIGNKSDSSSNLGYDECDVYDDINELDVVTKSSRKFTIRYK